MKTETFYTSDRNEWRKYLAEHYKTSNEIWLVFPLKNSAEESILYNDAVEEALCFGWIDSTVRPIDELHIARRFTPRRKGSSYSQPNIERLILLENQGLIMPEIRESVLPLIAAPFVFPADIIEELKRDETVWSNYMRFSESYRRIRVAYIDAARKRPDEFEKRLRGFIEKTRKNKIIKGFGGIEKYYK